MAETRVTEIVTVAETEGDAGVIVTKAGALVELSATQVEITKAGALIEIASNQVNITKAGVLIELRQTTPPGESEMATFAARPGGARALHVQLPDEVTGYAFDPAQSWWSVVVPEESENLIPNPSAEDNIADYTNFGLTSMTRVSGGAIGATRGIYAIQFVNVASGQGYVSYTVSSQPAGAYTWSLDVYVPTVGSQLRVETVVSGITQAKLITFRRNGWQRISLTRISLAASTWELRLVSPATNTLALTWRTDGWQLENKKYATTYLDGDMVGWYDTTPDQSYYWNGLAHASSSVRRANTGTGGRIRYFSDLINNVDFQTTAIVGAGMAPVEVDAVRVGRERELLRGIRILPRDFTITGRVFACDYNILRRGRNALIQLLRPNRTLGREPLILRYQETDSLGVDASTALEIVCAYTEGLQGNITNFYQESIGLQFHASVPYWMEEFDSALDLGDTPYESLVSNRIIYRDADGVYQNLGTGTTDEQVLALAFDANLAPIAGGIFTTLCGDTVSYLATWDGANWVAINGDEPDDWVYAIDVVPETNTIIIGGAFTAVGGGGAKRVAFYDGATWQEVATGLTGGTVYALAYDRYLGAIFVAGGTGGASQYVNWVPLNGGTWQPFPNGGLNSAPDTVLSTHDGFVWFGGSFVETQDTTIPLNRVCRYDIEADAWEALGAGFNGQVSKLVQGKDGFVYAFGGFTRDGDDTYDLRGAARWNGTTWEELFDASPGLATPETATVDADGVFWYADDDTAFPTSAFGSKYLLGWLNGVVYPPPFIQPADAAGIQQIAFGPNNEMLVAVGLSSATVTYAPKQFTIDVAGDADALPVFILRNEQTPVLLSNLDAKASIYFRSDFHIVDYERVFVNLSGIRPRFYSDARASLGKHIYSPASNITGMVLRPGTNRISILCVDDTGVTVSNSLVWRNRFLSIDAAEDL